MKTGDIVLDEDCIQPVVRFIFSQLPPESHKKWKTLMPWKWTLIDALIPKPAKIFPHYKTNGAERQIMIVIYNDTHFDTLERTSPLAGRTAGEAMLLPLQAVVWCRSLGSTCEGELDPCLFAKKKTQLSVIYFCLFFNFWTQMFTSFTF